MGFGGIVFSSNAATPANTLIENFATVDYVISGTPGTTVSNTDSFRVDEIISFTLVSNNPSGLSVLSPQTNAPLSFTLTNQGNGTESFSLAHTQSVTDDFDPSSSVIYLDTNANGIYDDGTDLVYNLGVNDPALGTGESLVLFVVSDIQASLSASDEAEINFTATSKTGAGPSGTAYNGLGDSGVDALMGTQGGVVTTLGKYVVATAAATLVKSQSILDPNGGTAPIQDAVITYTLTLDATGTGNLTSVVIDDPIPAGTTYEVGTLQLNSLPLTDAVDADAGVFNGTAVQVDLGTVVAPTTHTVQFKVRIQ
ncbi:MAG: hypothetical protein R3A80_10740 [Bdellovibrionota bacterium]